LSALSLQLQFAYSSIKAASAASSAHPQEQQFIIRYQTLKIRKNDKCRFVFFFQ
jgi:hypothetical protein